MIETNENYWDCECEEDYIHEKAKKKYCVKCNSLSFNQPDSRQNEVDILLEINDSQTMTDERYIRLHLDGGEIHVQLDDEGVVVDAIGEDGEIIGSTWKLYNEMGLEVTKLTVQ